ncbi:MAG: DUF2399 domain-containing protein [Clostridiales bacterium]|nr:DUF2399 domain-containing protein [Clostridiales bacterium]
MNKKYQKTGKYTGKIRFDNLTHAEQLFFSTIDINIMEQNYAEFSIQKFVKKKILTGILKDIDADMFWATYNQEKIITNHEIKTDFMARTERFFQEILLAYAGSEGGRWLAACLAEKKYGYRLIMKEYQRAPTELATLLNNVLMALNGYPQRQLLAMPFFATEITKDPHYFDQGSIAFSLLISGFCFFSSEEYPNNAEELQTLMTKFGLAKDLVSNQLLVFHISAINDGEIHQGIEYFNATNEVLSLTLKNIKDYEKIIVRNNKLFVFENPSVFSAATDILAQKNISLACTSGNLKLAAIGFLDKIAENSKIYYSGDLDPEGLKIADYLKERYQDSLVLWRMDQENYLHSLSQVVLDAKRISKLQSIKYPLLRQVAGLMEQKQLAGYQERLLGAYINDIIQSE